MRAAVTSSSFIFLQLVGEQNDFIVVFTEFIAFREKYSACLELESDGFTAEASSLFSLLLP